MLEVEILITRLGAVERQSEEGAVPVVLEVDFLVLLLDAIDRFLTPMVILAGHRWYSDGFWHGRVVLFVALGTGGGWLCF